MIFSRHHFSFRKISKFSTLFAKRSVLDFTLGERERRQWAMHMSFSSVVPPNSRDRLTIVFSTEGVIFFIACTKADIGLFPVASSNFVIGFSVVAGIGMS